MHKTGWHQEAWVAAKVVVLVCWISLTVSRYHWIWCMLPLIHRRENHCWHCWDINFLAQVFWPPKCHLKSKPTYKATKHLPGLLHTCRSTSWTLGPHEGKHLLATTSGCRRPWPACSRQSSLGRGNPATGGRSLLQSERVRFCELVTKSYFGTH